MPDVGGRILSCCLSGIREREEDSCDEQYFHSKYLEFELGGMD